MFKRLTLIACLLLMALSLAPQAAKPSYAQEGNASNANFTLVTMTSPCNLVSIDPNGGEVELIGSIGSGAEAFSLSPTGTLFAASALNTCAVHSSANTLITVDTQTGAGTSIGAIGFSDVEAIAFAPDGTLFGVDAASDNLIKIDPITGAGTVVGAVGFPFIGGIDFSPDGILYAADVSGSSGGPSTLLTINTDTGQGTAIGNIGFNTVEGLAFAADGTLFGISDFAGGGTGQLIEIDPVTGAGTELAQVITSGNMDGLGLIPKTLLSVHVLAADNTPESDLSWTIAPAMKGIVAATANDANKTALVLSDEPGDGNTVIHEVRNGVATPISGLPDTSGTLSTSITEYNTADGATLGGFLLWARNTYAADKVTFLMWGMAGR